MLPSFPLGTPMNILPTPPEDLDAARPHDDTPQDAPLTADQPPSGPTPSMTVTRFGAPTLKPGVRKNGDPRDGTDRSDWCWPVRAGGPGGVTLAGLATLVREPAEVEAKFAAPLWSGGTFEGGHHASAAFQSAEVLLLDVEGAGADIDAAHQALGEWWHAIYSTWSHHPDAHRFRVVLPLSRGVDGSEYRALIDVLGKLVTGVDPVCKKPGAWMFFPCARPAYVYRLQSDAPLFNVDAILTAPEPPPATEGGSEEEVPEDGDHPGTEPLDPTLRIEDQDGKFHEAAEWAEILDIGDKEQVFCPHVEQSTLGSAFLRRYRTNLLLCCSSQGHGHVFPLKQVLQVSKGEAEVLAHLRSGERGPYRSRGNLVKILAIDTRWKGRLWFDQYRLRPMYDDRPLVDADEIEIATWVEEVYGLEFGMTKVKEAVVHIAHSNPRDLLLEYLDGLVWDGQRRIKSLACDALCPEQPEMASSLVAAWMVGAVARAYDPGCKMDTALILAGPEACKKSSGLQALAGEEWFSDAPIRVDKPGDALLTLRSAWIHELPELDSIRRQQVTSVKAFLASTVDRARLPYGRHVVEAPRRCVIAGSTNEEQFLRSTTGNRRFWVVTVTGVIDLAWIKANRDQLWAEAIADYRQGKRWWFDQEHSRYIDSAITDHHREPDPWEEEVSCLLEGVTGPIRSNDVLAMLEIPVGQRDRRHLMRIPTILRRFGWKQRKSPWTPPGKSKGRWWERDPGTT